VTAPAAVAVALVVWSISLIRPVRVRALVYSLPVPMSLVLLAGPVRVDGTQVVGVLLLVAFFAATAVLHARLRWPVVPAVVTAAAGYVAAAWALPPHLPMLPCLLAVTALWLAGLRLPRPPARSPAPPDRKQAPPGEGPPSSDGSPLPPDRRPAPTGNGPAPPGNGPALHGSGPALHGNGPALHGNGPALHGNGPALHGNGPVLPGGGAQSRSWLPAVAKLGAVLAATFAVAGLAGLLAGLVVTFPYSGVLVAVEVRHELAAFTWHLSRTAIGLVAFVAGVAAGQGHGVAAGLAAGWLAFAGCALVVHRSGRPHLAGV
jgi:hypothetical protein